MGFLLDDTKNKLRTSALMYRPETDMQIWFEYLNGPILLRWKSIF